MLFASNFTIKFLYLCQQSKGVGHFIFYIYLEMEWRDDFSLDSLNLDCLLSTFPGNLEVQQVLGDIDEKLKKNASW